MVSLSAQQSSIEAFEYQVRLENHFLHPHVSDQKNMSAQVEVPT